MIKFLSSTRLTVICLFLLFVLTFWGTIAQVHHGLYLAQERFFNSFVFLAAGCIPFPGAQLVLWILFFNLLCTSIVTFKKYIRWPYAGLLMVHGGLLLYFVAAFMVFHVAEESHVRLTQGEATNVSTSYYDWEVAYWPEGNNQQYQVTAIDTTGFKEGYIVPFSSQDFVLSVKKFYSNCDDFIRPKPILKEREQNIAGGTFDITFEGKSHHLILYGAALPTKVNIAGKTYNFILRHKRYVLPFTIKLDSFKAEFYPGTQTAKSFESLVNVSTGTLQRQTRIFMNNPLRYKDYTLYQASYDVDANGREHSTLAVVKNFAKFLPYIACFVVFLGLALHFLIQAFSSRNRR